jgi:SrtB family sortase
MYKIKRVMMMVKNEEIKIDTIDEQSLLDIISASYLSLEDVKWLKSKRWFKRFMKVYSRELMKRNQEKPVKKKPIPKTEEEIEILDFTKTIKIPEKEIIEILDFTKTINITDIKDITEATEVAKNKVKKEKIIWGSILLVCVITLVVLMFVMVDWLFENKNTEDIVEEIYEVAEVEEVEETIPETTTQENKQPVITTTSLYQKYGNMNYLNVNFDNLKQINNDTVGWIKVEGTKINYPFVKTDNNEYYLKHSFDKSKNKKGWVFLDFRNDIENLSRNTILYAHGLVNNQMFGSLRGVLRKSWYTNKNNYIITIEFCSIVDILFNNNFLTN